MQQIDFIGAWCASLDLLNLVRPPYPHVSFTIEHFDYRIEPLIDVNLEYALSAGNNCAFLSEFSQTWLRHQDEDVDSTNGVNIEKLNVVMASHALEIKNHHFANFRASRLNYFRLIGSFILAIEGNNDG